MPGVLAVQAPRRATPMRSPRGSCTILSRDMRQEQPVNGFPLVLLVDDAELVARSLSNFLWVTFTRCDPATDIHGLGAFTRTSIGLPRFVVIDARIKPHHAPPLVEDPTVTSKIDALAARGGAVAKWL